MSPQSSTVAQLLKGFVLRGTLYPPLVSGQPAILEVFEKHDQDDILEIQPTRALSDTRGAEASTWAVRCSGVEWGTDESNVVDGIGVLKAGLVRQTAKGRDARKDGVGLIDMSVTSDRAKSGTMDILASRHRQAVCCTTKTCAVPKRPSESARARRGRWRSISWLPSQGRRVLSQNAWYFWTGRLLLRVNNEGGFWLELHATSYTSSRQ